MDLAQVVTVLLPIISAILGYFVKTVIDDVKQLTSQFNEFKSAVPSVYATKNDVNRDVDRVLEAIQELGRKFDSAIANRRVNDKLHGQD